MKHATQVLVIGAGQAGLAACYFLQKNGIDFMAVDASKHAGDTWRHRWDSLKLFTSAELDSLPGMKLPYPSNYLPSKDEMADYVQEYAKQFADSVHFSCVVKKLEKTQVGFKATTNRGIIMANQVIVATGPFHVPQVPGYAENLGSRVWQIHTHDYRNPMQIPEGEVVIVGAGNSGAQIAVELSKTHKVTVVCKRNRLALPQKVLGKNVFWWLKNFRVLNAKKGGFWSRYIVRHGDILVGKEFEMAIQTGQIMVHYARVEDASESELMLSDSSRLTAQTVIWATGYKPLYDWVQVDDVFAESGLPIHKNGVSPVRGLYWLGMPWQSSLKSGILYGVGTDAKTIVTNIR